MSSRKLAPMQYEGMRAMLSVAGLRPIVHSSVSLGTGTEDSYVVTAKNARRLLIYHGGDPTTPAFGDIRMEFDGTALATDFPIAPQTYVVMDMAIGDEVSFYNTAAGTVVVYVMEVE